LNDAEGLKDRYSMHTRG